VSLRVEREGDAVVLTIDRPATKNALDRELCERLAEAVRRAEEDPSARGIVLTSEGGETFVSGGDLNEISGHVRAGGGPEGVLDMYGPLATLETSELPVIVAAPGDIYGGGCELILLCDMVILEAHASLAFRHAKMGLSPAWGGLTRLVERAGPLEAARLLFTAEKIDAEEARRLGLVSEVVARGAARARAVALVARIAGSARSIIAAQKRALFEVREARRNGSIERERAVFAEVWAGPAHRAALDAFFRRKG